MAKKYLVTGIKEITAKEFNPIKNQGYFCKPEGGLWASTYVEKGIATYKGKVCKSEWQLFTAIEFESAFRDYGVVFSLKKEAKIAHINTLNDLHKLLEDYKQEKINPLQNDFLDYEKLAKDFDGIALSKQGEIKTRHSYPANLYGWDVESLLLFNIDCIEKQEYIEKIS